MCPTNVFPIKQCLSKLSKCLAANKIVSVYWTKAPQMTCNFHSNYNTNKQTEEQQLRQANGTKTQIDRKNMTETKKQTEQRHKERK